MIETTTIQGEHTEAEVMLPEEKIEEGLEKEIEEQVDNRAFQNPIKYMPDVHGGLGPHAIVGFSMKLGNRIIPNSVGGDIGCGMSASKLKNIEVDFDDIHDLRSVNDEVRERIAMGTGRVNNHDRDFVDLYPWPHANISLKALNQMLPHPYDKEFDEFDMEYFEGLCNRVGISEEYAKNSLGSLGSGNHFIEISQSESTGEYWVVVHSGSRNLGQKVAAYHQERATKNRDNEVKWDEMTGEQREYAQEDGTPDWKRIRKDFKGEKIEELGEGINSFSPDSNRNKKLDYLEGGEMYAYLKDMVFAQEYATHNRMMMINQVAETLDAELGEYINSPHNYVDFRDGVIRKGSTRASLDETFVVPMNMEDGTLLCRGKGNDDWNNSAPHGAGRLGSRGWAHEQFDNDEVRKRMYENGTYSTNVPTDEVPEAYKPMKLIENQIKPTAKVEERLVPKMNFKS